MLSSWYDQIIKDFNLPENTLKTFEEVAKALNALGFTHTNMRADPRPEPLDMMFNPWTMEIIRGPLKGHFIESINGLSYEEFSDKIKPYIAPCCSSKYHIRFVVDILRYSFPEPIQFSLKDVCLVKTPTGGKVFDQNKVLAKDNYIVGNRLYIKNFFEDLSGIREAIEQVRDDYDEWIIDVGSGGRREEVAKILITFFNPKDIPQDLYNSKIRRRHTPWIKDSINETDTTFGHYAFQGMDATLSTYKGKISLIIGGGVGSTSYVFSVFMLLMGGKWKIKEDTYILSKRSSRIQLVARSDYNRVSNRYNGEDGGHKLEYGLSRPNTTWVNPHRHLIGYFLVGRV